MSFVPMTTELLDDTTDITAYVRHRITQALLRRMTEDAHVIRFREAWQDAADMEVAEYGAVIEWDRPGVEEVTYEEPTVWFGRAVRR